MAKKRAWQKKERHLIKVALLAKSLTIIVQVI
jgi:hypothetical protein